MRCPNCNKPMTTARAMIVVKFARETWRNDGAEGETVHALCDEVEALREENLVLRGCLRDLLVVVQAQRHCPSCAADLHNESHLAGCAAASASAHARLALGDE